MISDVLEDQSSLDNVGFVVFYYHPCGTSCCYGVGFPPDVLPVWGFLFASGSAVFLSCISFRDIRFDRPVCSSSTNIGCKCVFCCSISKNRKLGHVRLADLYAT